jgi:hypothetical protein
MPLGGTESGLFRFPRVGEKVLVGIASNANYLMGYIPTYSEGNDQTDPKTQSSQDFQTDGMFENDGKGEVFRYKNNGVNFSNSSYSEIAFQSKYGSIEGAKIPMDSINIKSTGNIVNSAGNGYSLNADSLNIGIGGGNQNNAVISADAAGNVTIEAANSIALKVGRTTLNISDTSFSVTSKIADTPIYNTWDAGISLSPRKGFSASGINCKLGAVEKAVMSDSMGGVFSTTMGVGSIKGRELKMANYNATEYAFLNIFADIEFAENVAALINGMQYQDRRRDLQKNVKDQVVKEAEAKRAAQGAVEAEQKATKALKAAETARKALADKGSPETGDLRNAFNNAIIKAKEKEDSRHDAVEKAKNTRNAANKLQNDVDDAADWGNIVSLVVEWVGFIKTLVNTVHGLYRDLRDVIKVCEEAREMERKARLEGRDLKDLTQKELEGKAKDKAKKEYKKQHPDATDEDAEKAWEDTPPAEKGKAIADERTRDRKEKDGAYQQKLKDAATDSANKDLAKKKYEESIAGQTNPPAAGGQGTTTPPKKWEELSPEEQTQRTEDIKNATDDETKNAREELIGQKTKELEVEDEKASKADGVYWTGGPQPLPPQQLGSP